MFKILFLIFSPFACKAFPPITEKVVPQMFRNNSAKQGLIFPEKHPYFSKVPREVKDEVLRQAMEAKKEGERDRLNEIFAKPIEDQYTQIAENVQQHLLVNPKAPDYQSVLQAAKHFAKQGKKVKLLPIVLLEEFGEKIRNKILPNAKTGKNPDLLVDGKYVEVKEINNPTRGSINRRIRTAKTQADMLVVFIPKNSELNVYQYINKRAKELDMSIIVLTKKE